MRPYFIRLLNIFGIIKVKVIPVTSLCGIYYGILYKYIFSKKWYSEFGTDGFRIIYTREQIVKLGYKI